MEIYSTWMKQDFFYTYTTKSTFHQKGQDILCRKKTFQGENNCVLVYKPLMIGKARQPKCLNKANPDTHLSSTEVKCLPPTTTSFTQSIDQGIIQATKLKLRKKQVGFKLIYNLIQHL